MPDVRRVALLEHFRCLGDACEDTCCQGWGMQVDALTYDLYRTTAPEMLDDVTSGESERVMRRDPGTDFCVKFQDGWCGVHAKYGERLLGDACHFYPRVPRGLGDEVLMTAALSCPEIARLALLADIPEPLALFSVALDRLPASLRTYRHEEVSPEAMLQVHQTFLRACTDDGVNVGRIMRRIVSVAHSLPRLDAENWQDASAFLLRMADGRLSPGQTEQTDPYRVLQSLALLVYATRKPPRPRLAQLIAVMEAGLGVTLNWQDMTIAGQGNAGALLHGWHANASKGLDALLKRWLMTELSEAFFPFGGLGATFGERALVIAVRLATLQLALACHMRGNEPPEPDTVIRVVQTLARFMDHLGDPQLSLTLYRDAGWDEEARLGGLLETFSG